MTVEEGAHVVVRMRAGWEIRGEVRVVGTNAICILDPVLEEKLWLPNDEVADIRALPEET